MKSLPPKIPESQADLERAILLLGNRSRSELRAGPKEELRALVGHYPTEDQAQLWKTGLKKVRKQRLQET